MYEKSLGRRGSDLATCVSTTCSTDSAPAYLRTKPPPHLQHLLLLLPPPQRSVCSSLRRPAAGRCHGAHVHVRSKPLSAARRAARPAGDLLQGTYVRTKPRADRFQKRGPREAPPPPPYCCPYPCPYCTLLAREAPREQRGERRLREQRAELVRREQLARRQAGHLRGHAGQIPGKLVKKASAGRAGRRRGPHSAAPHLCTARAVRWRAMRDRRRAGADGEESRGALCVMPIRRGQREPHGTGPIRLSARGGKLVKRRHIPRERNARRRT